MKILPYEKIPAQFTPWQPVYLAVAEALIRFIETDKLEVIHIGSTSAKIGGKGIIDLAVLYQPTQNSQPSDVDYAVEHLKTLGFQDQTSAKPFPPERPRKDGAVMFQGTKYFIHAHIIANGCEEHQRLVNYKHYMLANPSARQAYEQEKQAILAQGVNEQECYGKLKSPFVKSILSSL